MATIHIKNHGLVIEAVRGMSLLNSFLAAQAPIHTVCGGVGRCGCCRVRIIAGAEGTSRITEAEEKRLGGELLAQGWRLSCQTRFLRDLRVYLPKSEELPGHCFRNNRQIP